jgi:hypothetical protein
LDGLAHAVALLPPLPTGFVRPCDVAPLFSPSRPSVPLIRFGSCPSTFVLDSPKIRVVAPGSSFFDLGKAFCPRVAHLQSAYIKPARNDSSDHRNITNPALPDLDKRSVYRILTSPNSTVPRASLTPSNHTHLKMAQPYKRPLSFSERRGAVFNEELSLNTHNVKLSQQRPRGPPTPSMSTPAADFEQVTGSPPPPPTPAASPGPSHARVNWSNAEEGEEAYLSGLRQYFGQCNGAQRTRLLADLLNICTSPQLSFVHQFVSPLLKKDPFTTLPDELCLRVRSNPHQCKLLWLTVCRSFPSLTTPKFSHAHRRCRGDGEIC